jgi:hypothetical protein
MIRPLAVLLQPLITSSKVISPLLLFSSSLSYSKAIVASGGLEFVSVKLTLTKANGLQEWNYYLLQMIQKIFLGGRGFLMLYSKG